MASSFSSLASNAPPCLFKAWTTATTRPSIITGWAKTEVVRNVVVALKGEGYVTQAAKHQPYIPVKDEHGNELELVLRIKQ